MALRAHHPFGQHLVIPQILLNPGSIHLNMPMVCLIPGQPKLAVERFVKHSTTGKKEVERLFGS